MEQHNYVSFTDYLQRCHIHVHLHLLKEDPMYLAKVWKAHRFRYQQFCQKRNAANEYALINEQVIAYELRLLQHQQHAGMSSQEYEDKRLRICSQGHFHP